MKEANPAKRFRLTVAYDGRPWAGWQSQVGGDTVQDQLLAALRIIDPEISTAQGSGRTDAGVSAIGQVAHFDTKPETSLDAGAWQRALNTRLPASIRIMDSAEVDANFHARFSAVAKTYRYRIWTGLVLPPLEAGLAWHVSRPGNRELLNQALNCFRGRHDFRAFSANRGDGKDAERDTNRELMNAQLIEEEDWLEISFTGNGFLYKMVRFLVGSAVRAAQEKLALETIKSLLKGVRGSEKAPYCAPPDGLLLVGVEYPDADQ